MQYNDEQFIIEIPPLTYEWSYNAKLYHLEQENIFYILNELTPIEGKEICKFSFFHTIIGDINKLDVICRISNEDNNMEHSVFDSVLEPILRIFCNDRIIALNFFYSMPYE
jgi:hypothetical protein